MVEKHNGPQKLDQNDHADKRDGQHADQPDIASAHAGNAVNVPKIESEATNSIQVGAGGTLIVPREDLDAGIIDGEELDLAALQAKKIRKPDRGYNQMLWIAG